MPDDNILSYLAKEFNAIYIVDLTAERMIPYVTNNDVSNSMLGQISIGQNYNQVIRDFADKYVLGVEYKAYLEAASIPRIRSELEVSDRYNYTFFRYDDKKKIELVEMGIIRLGDDMRRVIMTYKTVRESSINLEYERNEVQRKNAELLQARDQALQAVSNLFYTVYSVNVKKDSFVKIRAIPQISEYLDKQILASYALKGLPEATMKKKYVKSMEEILDMENWKELFSESDSITRDYESLYAGWCRMNIVVSKRDLKGNVTDVLICVQDIQEDKQKEMRHKLELANANARISESYGVLERLTYEYKAVWIVDEKNMSMELVKPIGDIKNNPALAMAVKNPYLDKLIDKYVENFVSKRDRKRVLREVELDFVLKKLHEEDIYQVNYKRIRSTGALIYHQIVFSRIETDSNEKKFILAFRDVDETVKKEMAEVARAERLSQYEKDQTDMALIHETLGSGGWRVEFDKNGEISSCQWSDEFRRKIGYESVEEFPNNFQVWLDALYEEDRDRLIRDFWNAVNDTSGQKVFDSEYRLITKDNDCRWFHAAGRFSRREDGTPVSLIGVFSDIDKKKRSEMDLQEQMIIVNALSDDYQQVFMINSENKTAKVIKFEGQRTSVDNKDEEITYPYYDLCEMYMEERVLPEDKKLFMEAVELNKVIEMLAREKEYISGYRILDKGEIHHYQFKFMRLNKGKKTGNIIAAFSNVDAVVKATRERENLRILSETDGMTQIANRSCGERLSREALSNNSKGMFCIMDVDNFKSINDTFGHDIGDKVLIEVANSLKKTFREKDIVFRLGGDEFAIMAIDIPSEEVGKRVVQRAFDYIEKIDIPELGDRKITVSMGAVIFGKKSKYTFETIYKEADVHVYASKKSLGSAVTF